MKLGVAKLRAAGGLSTRRACSKRLRISMCNLVADMAEEDFRGQLSFQVKLYR
jgi:hypothetical protein